MLLTTRTLIVLALAIVSTAIAAVTQKPNVILIMADDFGYECVTANGGQSYQTPNLDRLAASGVRFEHCHVQPLCTPTRVQLMTGLYNVRNYLEFGTMEPTATTFGHLFKAAGYATGICGKWQLGVAGDSPQRFGFDESFLWHHMRRESRYANPGFEHNGVAKDYKDEYGPKVLNDFALDFIERHREQPFFLYYPMLLTHAPFQPTPDSTDWNPALGERSGKDARHFAEMTAYMDKMIGRLVAKLEASGLRGNTLIIFLGDNGTGAEITSRFKGESYPGGKGRGSARGTHVPLIASWPGQVPAGRVNSDLISSVDFLPTMCAAAGVAVPKTLPPDGRSFLPQLLGKTGEPREWAYCWYAPDGGATPKFEFAMTKQYKLYRDGTFFDLASDRFEDRPLRVERLAGAQAAGARKLQSVLDEYATARPAHLLQPIVTTKQAKKAQKKKKNE